ncbi:MAG TPA: phage portal protein, partial [Burkholderiales bacterium]|nr:phage portal protein [Burkholderiales bacterium]
HDAPNPEMSSFDWRKYVFDCVFTGGRGYTFIERNAAGQPINLWPLDPDKTTVKRENLRKYYEYKENGRTIRYEADEVIDIPFLLKADRLSHRSPLLTNKETIGLAIAATRYGSKFFANGGVPPFAIEGPFNSPAGVQRAGEDLKKAIKKAAAENRLALPLPPGHSIKNLGIDPEKSQLVETKRFIIEEVARIYSLPPTFLQDLTHGTFSNTEQQDLHVTKHTLRRWIVQFEQEINLKLFGRGETQRYVEMSVDGLLRGDFKTRMEGYAQAIQNAVYTPAEVRSKENLPDKDGSDQLLIQGATVPLGQQPNQAGDGNDDA